MQKPANIRRGSRIRRRDRMLDCRGYQSDKPSYNNADTRICIRNYSLLEVISRSLNQSLLTKLMFEYASMINGIPISASSVRISSALYGISRLTNQQCLPIATPCCRQDLLMGRSICHIRASMSLRKVGSEQKSGRRAEITTLDPSNLAHLPT